MRMTKFRVQKYKGILDSGWVEVNDLAVIVGKNESGKTSILKALWKFNPFKEEPYNLNREWPRSRRKEMSEIKSVVTIVFDFTSEEKGTLETIDACFKEAQGVEIERNYKGDYTYKLLPLNPVNKLDIDKIIHTIKERLIPQVGPRNLIIQHQEHLEVFIRALKSRYQKKTEGDIDFILEELSSFRTFIYESYSTEDDEEPIEDFVLELKNNVDDIILKLAEKSPYEKAMEAVNEWLPTFIYMSDYKIFNGSAQLDEVKERKDNNRVTDEDRTIVLIMELAGLSLDDEVEKGGLLDREQRILDMNDASQALTEEIANRWTQKKYEVMFQADGQHFITFVKDADSKSLIPLEERSKGFQWFFSFDMTFMYETKGEFKNAIILLDEPGLHLHAAAQRDLLARLKEYAKSNQLIYTTHLPFMLDFSRLDNIYVAEDMGIEGTKVHKDWATADKDARFTLQAALGLSWSQSLFVGQYNLVVEGVTDFWFLTTISTMLQDEGQNGIDEQLVITPAGGASKVAYIGTILHGQKLNVMVLLDSDVEGKSAYEQLVHQWIINDKHVLMLGEVLGVSHSYTLEDLFSEDYYLEHVNAAYYSELGKKNLKLGKKSNQPIIERVEIALKAQGIERFNKGRVAKRIMKDLANKNLVDIHEETIEKFGKVITAINNIVQVWKTK